MGGGGFCRSTDRVNDSSHESAAEPARGPCSGRDFDRGFREGFTRAKCLVAEQPPLGPDDFHRPSHGDVADALLPARMATGANDTAPRAAGFNNALNMDSALAKTQCLGCHDTVIVQIEDRGGSIRGHQSRLVQGS